MNIVLKHNTCLNWVHGSISAEEPSVLLYIKVTRIARTSSWIICCSPLTFYSSLVLELSKGETCQWRFTFWDTTTSVSLFEDKIWTLLIPYYYKNQITEFRLHQWPSREPFDGSWIALWSESQNSCAITSHHITSSSVYSYVTWYTACTIYATSPITSLASRRVVAWGFRNPRKLLQDTTSLNLTIPNYYLPNTIQSTNIITFTISWPT